MKNLLYALLLSVIFLIPFQSFAQERGQTVIVRNLGAANAYTKQFTASTAAALALPARTTRHTAQIKNMDAAIVVYYGYTSAVTAATGMKLGAGEVQPIDSQAPVYVIAASGAPVVSFSESYD